MNTHRLILDSRDGKGSNAGELTFYLSQSILGAKRAIIRRMIFNNLIPLFNPNQAQLILNWRESLTEGEPSTFTIPLDSTLYFYTMDDLTAYLQARLRTVVSGGGDWTVTYNPATTLLSITAETGYWQPVININTAWYKLGFADVTASGVSPLWPTFQFTQVGSRHASIIPLKSMYLSLNISTGACLTTNQYIPTITANVPITAGIGSQVVFTNGSDVYDIMVSSYIQEVKVSIALRLFCQTSHHQQLVPLSIVLHHKIFLFY